MATLPCSEAELIDAFGPHLNFEPPGGFAARGKPDRVVETHCCFCGQQCGVKLVVKDEKVVGVEPWEEFPFNRGKLCPKGIKRYCRTTIPTACCGRWCGSGRGFEPVGWDEALDIVVERIERIQRRHGRDAFAVLGGASLTNEKAYLMGKFARLALRTRHIDYNGRLCMVSAGAGNLKAFGIDRAANPWADIASTDLIMVLGSNVSECSPITTDYIWRARDRGARLIVVDPRLTPIARTADLFLPVRPGRDSALMNAILHAVIRLGGVDQDFIAAHTNGFDELQRTVEAYAPERVEALVGIPAARIIEAAELLGAGAAHHAAARTRHRASHQGRRERPHLHQPGAGDRQDRQARLRLRDHHRPGQRPGRARARPALQPVARRARHREPGPSRRGRRTVGRDCGRAAGKGATAPQILEKIHAGEIRGLLSLCFNPMVSLPDTAFTRAALERLDFFVAIDFFMSETGAARRSRSARLAAGGGRGHGDEHRGPRHPHPPGGAAARRGAPGLEDHLRHRRASRLWRALRLSRAEGDLRRAAHAVGRRRRRLRRHHLREDRAADGRVLAVPDGRARGHAAALEGGGFAHPDGRARFHAIEYRPPAEDTDDGIRSSSPPAASSRSSSPATRRAASAHWSSSTRSRRSKCTRGWRAGSASSTATASASSAARRAAPRRPRGADHPPRHRLHSLPLAGAQSANILTVRAYDPISGIPEFKVAAVRIERLPRSGWPQVQP
jgi:assimilatory nitrate reductase catalytic subunit